MSHDALEFRVEHAVDQRLHLMGLKVRDVERRLVVLGECGPSVLVVHGGVTIGHEYRRQSEGDDLIEAVVARRADRKIESIEVAAEREAA